jgi:hypothetical protein
MSGHEDCRYWGLTAEQCFRYHRRVSRWQWKRARVLAVRARELSEQAVRLQWVALALWILAFSLMTVAAVLG